MPPTLLMVEMLEHHDRERFEVTLYSHGKDDGSAVRRRISAACEHFVDMRDDVEPGRWPSASTPTASTSWST